MFFGKRSNQRSRLNERRLKLKPAPDGLYGTNDNPRVISEIMQSEVAFASFERNRLIASPFAGPCVIFILYEREKKQGLMTHLYTYSEISLNMGSGKSLLSKCATLYAKGIVDIYMLGGYPLVSDFLINAIDDFVNELDNSGITINSINKQLQEEFVTSVIFNFDTGEVFSYDKFKNMDKNKRNLACCGSPQERADCIQGIYTSSRNLFPFFAQLIEYDPPAKSEPGEIQSSFMIR
jgi:hypothetical protein